MVSRRGHEDKFLFFFFPSNYREIFEIVLLLKIYHSIVTGLGDDLAIMSA